MKQEMIDMADVEEYFGMWMAHETDYPLRDVFPSVWMGIGKDALEYV
jgi:hypothetical protein